MYNIEFSGLSLPIANKGRRSPGCFEYLALVTVDGRITYKEARKCDGKRLKTRSEVETALYKEKKPIDKSNAAARKGGGSVQDDTEL